MTPHHPVQENVVMLLGISVGIYGFAVWFFGR